MWYDYVTDYTVLSDPLVVCHTDLSCGDVTVRCGAVSHEKRIASRVLICDLPRGEVVYCLGFSEPEVRSIVNFLNRNAEQIMYLAKVGGVKHA